MVLFLVALVAIFGIAAVILYLLLREALTRLRAGTELDARVIAESDPEEEAAIARFKQ